MTYRRSTRAQHQRLVFLAVYVVLSTIATWSASTKHSIGNNVAPRVIAAAPVHSDSLVQIMPVQ
ncbi:MAG: hypothetical protein IPO95_01105 [Rhodanobacteraceae bacterium]|nr:hypothetical protein [Rhodanobacteraceae bacterium]MBL0040973.1 hypothetical protein [Xanthomonadales bacterium]MBP7624367.1 hypothetical protein [Xanthomonadales bacterium]